MPSAADGIGATCVPRTHAELDRRMLLDTLELAELGRPSVRPNPLVGAILARSDGTILARGHHARRGEPHAERVCLSAYPEKIPDDATLYVSLEPCNHTGATPPCSEHVIERGVRRVVYASSDPNPVTAGLGPARLAQAGVTIERAPIEIERRALQQNAGFHSEHLRGRPYVTAKFAMTENGRFATGDAQRRWISGETSRTAVHGLRAGSGAIACGIGTICADDPRLTVRGAAAERIHVPPIRVVFDRTLRLPIHSQIIATIDAARVLVVCSHDAPIEREHALVCAGAEVRRAPAPQPGSPCILAYGLQVLAEQRVQDVLLEAGPQLLDSFMQADLIDASIGFVAPFTAPESEPGLALDHPLIAVTLDGTSTASGDDTRYDALLHPAWEMPGA